MTENSVNEKTPSLLEALNKQLAKEQAHEINRGLTQLKRVSVTPKKRSREADQTGKFVTVPINGTVTETIDSACKEAEKTYSDSGIELKKKPLLKKWFKWG